MRKLYAKISASGADGEHDASIDCTEFLDFCKRGKICDGKFSMAAALEVFMYCNTEEMQATKPLPIT